MQHFSPKQRYEQDLAKPGFQPDLAQAQAVDKLQGLYDRLIAQEAKPRGVAARLRRVFGEKSTPEQGLYFWGGVGRGKTYLVDVFYESLPFDAKLRVHFHRFMQRVHQELTTLAGEKNPLEQVAAGIASETRVICFDEFFVSDIADAMILAGLMTALFQRGVTLVATSNIEPVTCTKMDCRGRGSCLLLSSSKLTPTLSMWIRESITGYALSSRWSYGTRRLMLSLNWR